MKKEIKIHKAISITKEANEIIAQLQRDGFNFSKWVCEKILEEFDNIENMEAEIKNKEIEIQKLVEKKKQVTKRKHQIRSELNQEAINFVKSVPERIERNFDKKELLRFFNNKTGLDYSMRRFLELVRYYNEN